jgi:hypothetical protein
VRDTALALQNEAPTSDINREYYAQNMEGKVCTLNHIFKWMALKFGFVSSWTATSRDLIAGGPRVQEKRC